MSIAVEDWDDLSDARRKRDERAAAEAVAVEPAESVAANGVRRAVVHEAGGDDEELGFSDAENLRPLLWVAGGNIVIWAIAHLSGVVELIGVSFMASVGLLLAAYVLREWHRDRSALICLAGALPLPVTIFSLLT
jgi:hypothetical protein